MIAFLLALAAVAVPADTSQCAKVAPVSTSIDIVALQVDADCFGAAAASDKAGRDALSKAATSAAASQKLRLDRIAYVKAHPPAPPPPPPTHTCPDGTVILATAVCPPPPPPPPPVMVHCPDGSMVTPPAVCPVAPPPAPPPAAGFVPAPTLDGLADIPTPDFTAGIGSGLSKRGPTPSNVPDNVGAMRFICGPGPLLKDDPIVFPGQPGRSHLHQTYGNEDFSAFSTYDSLRKHGRSTCSGPANALNRSAYWMIAMLNGMGAAVVPDNVAVYYKRYPHSSAMCGYLRAHGGDCVMQPNGLRWIMGNNPANWNSHLGAFHWGCINPSTGQTLHKVAGDLGSYPTLGDVTPFCTAGWHISLAFDGPGCWDGKNLDTPDHQSHMANEIRATIPGNNGVPISINTCPKDHPYMVPNFKLTTAWAVMAGDDTTKWESSADRMCPIFYPGCAVHLDLFDAWDSAQKRNGMENCLNKLIPYDTTKFPNYPWAFAFPRGPNGEPQGPVSGQGGDQCDGTQLTGAGQPIFGWGVNPNRIVPLDPVTGEPIKQPPLP
jgi:hypothetical protein